MSEKQNKTKKEAQTKHTIFMDKMVNNRRINMVLKTIEFEYNETIKMRSPNPRRAMEDGD